MALSLHAQGYSLHSATVRRPFAAASTKRNVCTRAALQASPQRQQAQATLKKVGGALLATAAALQLSLAGPAYATIGGSGTPFGPKPDSGRETSDRFGETAGGPSTGKALEKRSSLGGQQPDGPSGAAGSKPTSESSGKGGTLADKLNPFN